MNKQILNNNVVIAAGQIVSDFKYSHVVFSEAFYCVDLKIRRTSGNYDVIPLLVSERLMDVHQSQIGTFIIVKGQFRSFNRTVEGRRTLVLLLFAREIEYPKSDREPMLNTIVLDGYLCKKTGLRVTPKGRQITDFMLAVNRAYGHADYIPCICWGRTANYVSQLPVGSRFRIQGRIQSRNYQKKLTETDIITRTAYEVSVNTLESVPDTSANTNTALVADSGR